VYLPVVLAFAAVTFGTLALVFLWEVWRRVHQHRAVLQRLEAARQDDDAARDLFRVEPRAESGLNAAITGLANSKDIALALRRAGLGWSPATLVLLVAGSAGAFGTVVWLAGRIAWLALIAAALGSLVPVLYVKHRQKARLRAFESQFPEAIDLMSRAIRAGHPLSAGIRMVAEEAPEPTAGEFRQLFEEQRFGLPFEDALLGLADRNALVDVRILVTAVLIQREAGGNLAEILDKIAQTVRARFTIRRQLRVYTAQGRLSGYVLAALPIVVALAIFAIDRSYASMLVTEPLGRAMVIVAVVMQILGYLWIRRIIDIEI
jgi:tight adherence protein B